MFAMNLAIVSAYLATQSESNFETISDRIPILNCMVSEKSMVKSLHASSCNWFSMYGHDSHTALQSINLSFALSGSVCGKQICLKARSLKPQARSEMLKNRLRCVGNLCVDFCQRSIINGENVLTNGVTCGIYTVW